MTDHTNLPALEIAPTWHEAMARRTSRRSYAGEPLSTDQAARLTDLSARLSVVHAGVRVVFVNRQVDDIFSGIVGAYGVVIQNAPAFAAFIGSGDYVASDATGSTDPDRIPMYADVALGRIGEAFVLEATTLGLGTCWVAGSFDRSKAARYLDLADSEHVRAVTPVGLAADREGAVQRAMQRLVRARARLDLDAIAPGCALWPKSALEVVEAVRVAPSGKNSQPWRLAMDGDQLVLSHAMDSSLVATYMADLGIALMHAEVGLDHAGVQGEWSYGRPTSTGEVARFTPRAGW